MHDLLAPLIHWYLETLDQGGYLLIGLLMAMESSIIPLPSEFVIPPAAYLAHSRDTFTYAGIVIAGTVGSWVGASVMYWLSRSLGRRLLMRYGRYLLITPEKIEQAEIWSAHYGTMGVFVARILPVIRHLIGIPAGIVRLELLEVLARDHRRIGTVVQRARVAGRHGWTGPAAARGQPPPHHAVGRRPDAVPVGALLRLRAPAHAALMLPAQRIGPDGRPHVDFRAIGALAFPLMLNSGLQVVISLTDTWFVGHISTTAMAGLAAIYWVVLFFVMVFGGIGLAVQTIVAQAEGSRRRWRAGHATWVALWGALITVPFFAGFA